MADAEPGADRRRAHERHAIEMDAICFEIEPSGEPRPMAINVKVQDVSRGGMGLLLPRFIHKGRPLLVIVTKGEDTRTFYGVAQHCRHVRGSEHFVGLQFAPMPVAKGTMAWLQRFGAPLPEHASHSA